MDGRRVHTDMEMWTEIRRKVLVEGASKRSIRRDFRIGSETLEKILANAEPPGYRQGTARPKPQLGQFLGVIDEILSADNDAPVKQRHTAKRIFERLRDEHGYVGCSSQVRAQVAQARKRQKEVFVPLSHPPGEAQYDFGEATVIIAGVQMKAALSVMTLPYSDVFHVSAYPRECTETFQAGHVPVGERAPEACEIRRAEAFLRVAVQHRHEVELLREPVGELAGAVGRVVVDHEHADAVRRERAEHRLEVLALVVRRQADRGVRHGAEGIGG